MNKTIGTEGIERRVQTDQPGNGPLRSPSSGIRKANWESLLAAAILARVAQPFVWGATDCVRSAAQMVATYTHLDFSADIPDLAGEEANRAFLARHGGLLALVDSALARRGVHQTSVNAAVRGDVALVDLPSGAQCIGIVGPRGVLIPGTHGLITVPRRRATHAWRIA